MLREIVVAAVVGGVTSGLFAILWHRVYGVRIQQKLAKHLIGKLDALAATALELAVEDTAEIEEASLSFTQVADRLLANGLVAPEGHEELLEMWEVRTSLAQDPQGPGLSKVKARALLARIEILATTLDSLPPPRGR